MSRQVWAALAGVALSISSVAAWAQDVRLGFTGPVTGPVAFLGQHMKWGAELAVSDINERGGVLGRNVALTMQDSQCRPADALSGAEKLLSQDGVDVLFGDLCSGATLALMPIAERAKKPMVVSISTLPAITDKAGAGGNVWIFRTVPTDSMMAANAAVTLAASSVKSIAFLAEDTDYGRESVRLFKAKLDPALKVISEDYFKTSDADFLAVLTRLRSSRPGALGVFMLDQQGFNLMKQYVQFGLTMPLVGRPPLLSTLVEDLLKTGKFDGSWTVYPYYAGYESAANDAFVKRFAARFGQNPHYVAYGMFEAFQVVAKAIAEAGSTDGEALRKALASIRYPGILGEVAFDDHHQAHNPMLLLTVAGGRLGVKVLPPAP